MVKIPFITTSSGHFKALNQGWEDDEHGCFQKWGNTPHFSSSIQKDWDFPQNKPPIKRGQMVFPQPSSYWGTLW